MNMLSIIKKFLAAQDLKFEETKYNNAEEALKTFQEVVNSVLGTSDKIKMILEEAKIRNIASCPDCHSNILVEYGTCPFCGCLLMGSNEEKETKVKEAKTEVKEAKTEVKEAKTEETKVEEDFEYPNEDEIFAMKKTELMKLIKDHKEELLVDPKGMKVSDLREAVNDAINELYEGTEEEEEVEEGEIDLDSVSSDDFDDFDLGLDDDLDFEE